MVQRNRSRDVQTGRRRLGKLLAATGTLAGGLWITSQVPAAEPPRDVHDVSVARLESVCRVLGVQRRVVGEPRAWQVQPCQALAPIVGASSELPGESGVTESSGLSGSADTTEPIGAGVASVESPGTEATGESETAVRLLTPVADGAQESPGTASAEAFSPFRFAPSAHEATSHAPAPSTSTQRRSTASFDAGDRSPNSPPSPTSSRDGGPTVEHTSDEVGPGGENSDKAAPPNVAATKLAPRSDSTPEDAAASLAPVGGRRTARATPASQSPHVDPSRQTMQALQDLQSAQAQPTHRRLDNGGHSAAASVDPLFEVIPESGEMSVAFQESKMLRLREPVGKVAVVDPTVCEVVQFSPREICLLGKSPGATNITFWVGQSGGRPATYRVTVEADPRAREMLAAEYRQFEQLIGELFPQSNVRLLLIADKVIVKGEAKDETEAMRILSVLRQANAENPASFVSTNGLAADFGPAARLASVAGDQTRSVGRLQLINMLHVAGRPNELVTSPGTTAPPAAAAPSSMHDAFRSAKKP